MIIDLSELRWSIDANKALNLQSIPRSCFSAPAKIESEPTTDTRPIEHDAWFDPDPENEGVSTRHLQRLSRMSKED